MNYYPILKKLLFCLDPETAHNITLKTLNLAYFLKITRFFSTPSLPCHVMGIQFPNPVGLAAGLDKSGDYIEALSTIGFGFVEVGTITPKPQVGNPLPRLFRISEREAIINRMGFNNKGLDYLIERLKKIHVKNVLGINIGKNRDTPIENAINDYVWGFKCVAPYAHYVTINISSPNTPGLRSLQHGDLLTSLLKKLKEEQNIFFHCEKKYVPLVVKISPDLTRDELTNTAEILLAEKIDGIIATNTTINREGVEQTSFAKESGGLSGKPLAERSTQVIYDLNCVVKNEIPIIACGGIFSKSDVKEKISAGAKLIQLYSALIYRGPRIIHEMMKAF